MEGLGWFVCFAFHFELVCLSDGHCAFVFSFIQELRSCRNEVDIEKTRSHELSKKLQDQMMIVDETMQEVEEQLVSQQRSHEKMIREREAQFQDAIAKEKQRSEDAIATANRVREDFQSMEETLEELEREVESLRSQSSTSSDTNGVQEDLKKLLFAKEEKIVKLESELGEFCSLSIYIYSLCLSFCLCLVSCLYFRFVLSPLLFFFLFFFLFLSGWSIIYC